MGGGERGEMGEAEGISGEPRNSTFQTQAENARSDLSEESVSVGRSQDGSLGADSLPEHVIVAVYLLAHVGVVQDAPVAHHCTGDALGAPSREAGQEQLLLGHRREEGHNLLHH